MELENRIEKILEKYGEEITATVSSVTYTGFAYIQSEKAMKKSLNFGDFSEYGYDNEDKLLCIATKDSSLDTLPINTVITAKSGSYVLKSSANALFKGEVAYVWAYLEKAVT